MAYLLGLVLVIGLVGCDKFGFVTFERNQALGEVPAILEFSGPQKLISGECRPMDIVLKGETGGLSRARNDMFIQMLAVNDTDEKQLIAFYEESACDNSTSSITLAAGKNTATVYVSHQKAQSIKLTAIADGMQTAIKVVEIAAGTPRSLILNGLSELGAGQCSGYSAVLLDNDGNASAVAQAVVLSATVNGNAKLYNDEFCTSENTSGRIQVSPGETQAVVYMKDPKQELVSLSVGTSQSGQVSKTVRINAGPPSRVRIASEVQGANKTLTAGTCSQAFIAEVTDAFGNPAPVPNGATISLEGINTEAEFYRERNGLGQCANPVPGATLSLSAGTSRARFFFRNIRAQGVVVSAVVEGLSVGNWVLTVNPDVQANVSIRGAEEKVAGKCEPYVVELQDQFLNPAPDVNPRTVTLGEQTGRSGYYYANMAACGLDEAADAQGETLNQLPNSQIVIPAGQVSTTVYYRSTVAQDKFLQGTVPGLNSLPTDRLTVDPEVASVASSSVSITATDAGKCTQVDIFALDKFGNQAPSAVARSITFQNKLDGTANDASGAYYTLGQCNQDQPTAGTPLPDTVTLAANVTAYRAYYRNDRVEDVDLKFEISGLGNSENPIDIGPAIPARLLFNSGTTILDAGNCSNAYDVRIEDQYGNSSPLRQSHNLTPQLNVSNLPGLTAPARVLYYSGGSCGGAPISQLNLGVGVRDFEFSMRPYRAQGSRTISVSGVLQNGEGTKTGVLSTNVTVNPAVASQMHFTDNLTSLATDSCHALNLRLRDQFFNLSPAPPGGYSFGLSSNPGNDDDFYSNLINCSNEVNQIFSSQFSAGTDDVTVYYRSNVSKTVDITAGNAQLSNVLVRGEGDVVPSFGLKELDVFSGQGFVANRARVSGERLILAGYRDAGTRRFMAAVAISSSGTVEWEQNFACDGALDSEAKDLYIASGKVVLAGYRSDGTDRDSCIALLDLSGGIFRDDIGFDASLNGEMDEMLSITGSGSSLVTGGYRTVPNGSETVGHLRRFTMNTSSLSSQGILDIDFTPILDSASSDFIRSLVLVGNDVFAAGDRTFFGATQTTELVFAKARLSGSGLITQSFPTSAGFFVADSFPSNAVAASISFSSNNNQLYASGRMGGDLALARFSTSGSSLMTRTSNLGGVEESFAGTIDSSGNFLVFGSRNGNFLIAKYSASLSLRTQFGSGGFVSLDFGSGSDRAVGGGIETGDGYLYVGGHTVNNSEFDVAVTKLFND